MPSKKRALGVLLAVGLGLVACGSSRPLAMEMRYAPTSTMQIGQIPGGLLEVPMGMGAIVLARDRPEGQIGAYDDDGVSVPVSASDESIRQTVRQGLERNLRLAGLRLDGAAEVQLRVTVVDFWVEEGHLYEGVVRLKVDVMRGEQVTGSVVVDGTATRWGSTMDADNYREVLSDSLLEATQKLLSASAFAQAVIGEAGSDEPGE